MGKINFILTILFISLFFGCDSIIKNRLNISPTNGKVINQHQYLNWITSDYNYVIKKPKSDLVSFLANAYRFETDYNNDNKLDTIEITLRGDLYKKHENEPYKILSELEIEVSFIDMLHFDFYNTYTYKDSISFYQKGEKFYINCLNTNGLEKDWSWHIKNLLPSKFYIEDAVIYYPIVVNFASNEVEVLNFYRYYSMKELKENHNLNCFYDEYGNVIKNRSNVKCNTLKN